MLGARWPRTRGPFGYRPGDDDSEELAPGRFDPETVNSPPIDLTDQLDHQRQDALARARREAAYYAELERIIAMPEAERAARYPAWMVREAIQVAARRREQDRPAPAPPAPTPASPALGPRERYYLDR
jgi:hypothetical protein